MTQALIQFDHVVKSFGSNTVLKGVTLGIPKGAITTVIGKSGTGKSVLLKHMIGLIRPDKGQVLFQGKPISKLRGVDKKAFKHQISYMFQGSALFDSMTVYDNIALPLLERSRVKDGEIHRKVREKMEQLDLFNIDQQYPSQISGGMKKRVALARALVTDPEIILFDEPTTGLDPIRKHAVHSMISEYQKRFGFTGVVVSHEIPDVFHISQRIVMLDEGAIIFEGEPYLLQESSNPVIRDFIRGHESRLEDVSGMAPQPIGEKRFKEEMARLVRYRMPFSVILLTITNLDEINSKIGHMATQAVMKDFAGKVQKHLRIIDTCFRSGLHRLMIVLSCSKLEQARITCARLSNELSRAEIVELTPYPEFCFRITAGFVEIQKECRLEDILSSADSWQNMSYEFRVC